VRAQLDPGGVLPGTIETLHYTAEMEFDRPWDIRAIEDRRPQITALDLRRDERRLGRADPARGGRC
jgi:hypothetical protein